MAYKLPDHFTLFTEYLSKKRPGRFFTEEQWTKHHDKAAVDRASVLDTIKEEIDKQKTERKRKAAIARFKKKHHIDLSYVPGPRGTYHVDFSYKPPPRGTYEGYASHFFNVQGVKTLLDRCSNAKSADLQSDRLREDLEPLIRPRTFSVKFPVDPPDDPPDGPPEGRPEVFFSASAEERERFRVAMTAAFRATIERIQWNERFHQAKPASQTLGQSQPQSEPSREPNPGSFVPADFGGVAACVIVSYFKDGRHDTAKLGRILKNRVNPRGPAGGGRSDAVPSGGRLHVRLLSAIGIQFSEKS